MKAKMKTYENDFEGLFAVVMAATCNSAFVFAADKPSCKSTGKNCPMNDDKACNCGKDCGC